MGVRPILYNNGDVVADHRENDVLHRGRHPSVLASRQYPRNDGVLTDLLEHHAAAVRPQVVAQLVTVVKPDAFKVPAALRPLVVDGAPIVVWAVGAPLSSRLL